VGDVDYYILGTDDNKRLHIRQSRVWCGSYGQKKSWRGSSYVQYTPVISFRGAYNNHVVTLHDFEVGVKKTLHLKKLDSR